MYSKKFWLLVRTCKEKEKYNGIHEFLKVPSLLKIASRWMVDLIVTK